VVRARNFGKRDCDCLAAKEAPLRPTPTLVICYSYRRDFRVISFISAVVVFFAFANLPFLRDMASLFAARDSQTPAAQVSLPLTLLLLLGR
jgi:hypothetical protein